MAKIIWDEVSKRFYETGVEQGVLYLRNNVGAYPKGVAWNGLISIAESPSGAESTPVYADNIQYLNMQSAEKFGATMEAYMYPPEFGVCDGTAEIVPGVFVSQQTRKTFGLAYKTLLGNDLELNDYGYKLHLVYGAIAAPSEKSYGTINESPEAMTFSWELSTTPVEVPGHKPTASLIIDSTTVDATALASLEAILFGTAEADARLPLPTEIIALFAATLNPLELSTIVPADDGEAVALDADMVLTFNNKVLHEVIIVTDASGAIVAASKTWDETGKILTINPTNALTANTTYLVTIGGVIDIYNQALTPAVKNFTTTAG